MSSIKKEANKVDHQYISIGDFSLLVDNIPKDVIDAKDVYDYFNSNAGEVDSVLLLYDVRKFAVNQMKLDELVKRV